MNERVRIAGFGAGAPEDEQLLEAAHRIRGDGGKLASLTAMWGPGRELVHFVDAGGYVQVVMHPDDVVALGFALPE